METLRGAQLDIIEISPDKIYWGVPLPDKNVIIAFGDRTAPDGSGEPDERWKAGEDYLVQVIDGFNTKTGQDFIDSNRTNHETQYFSYIESDSRYKVPCTIKTSTDNSTVVVIYSFGPK